MTTTEQRPAAPPVEPLELPEPVADLSPPPPTPSLAYAPCPFLDLASFQTDFTAGYRELERPWCWLLERRDEPVVTSDTTVDQEAVRNTSPGWLGWLCQFGPTLRAVRVEHPKDRGELRALCVAGAEVRLVHQAHAARSVLPNMLVLGGWRAYCFQYRHGVFIGALRVGDRELIDRWRSGVAQLHARGARVDTDGPA